MFLTCCEIFFQKEVASFNKENKIITVDIICAVFIQIRRRSAVFIVNFEHILHLFLVLLLLTLNKQILAEMLSTLTDLSTTSISLNFECLNVLSD